MRADRLVAALLVLQSRGRVTASELAEELEVSVKTARRDLEALAMAGIPVYSSAGRGGGWSLLGGARTDLSGLTATEAQTLFLVAGPSATVDPKLKAALRKLVRALPATFRADAEAAASAVVIDPTRWGGTEIRPPRHLEVLQRAVIDSVQVRLGYSDREGAVTERIVHPLGLVQKGNVWYLLAGTEKGNRTFRVGRVRSVEVTDEPAHRPEGFDLAKTWEAVSGEIEQRRRAVTVVIHASPWVTRVLSTQFGTDLNYVRELDDGRSEVTIGAPSAEIIGDQLSGWGKEMEVVGPPEVRAHLARIGAELVERYADAG